MRNKDVLRVAAARLISRAGGEAAFFIGVWGKAAFDLKATPSQIAIIMATLSLSSIAGTVIAGVLVDRFDPRRVLMVSEFFFVPITLAFILPSGMTQLCFLVGLLGFFGAPVYTAAASFAPFIATDEMPMEKVNAWIEGAASSSFVIGPAIGAVLVSTIGLNGIWVFDGLTSLAAALLVWRVQVRPIERKHEQAHPLQELKDGLKYTYSHRALRYPILIGTAVWFSFGAFSALEPLFYRDVVHTGVQSIGWMNSLFGAGMVAGAWLFTKLPSKVNTGRGLAIMASLTGLGALAYVGTRLLPVIAIGSVIWGVIIGITDILLRVRIQAASPDELVGRIAGASHMHRSLGELVPLSLAPGLALYFGIQQTLIGSGLVLAVLALLTLREAGAVDRLPALRPSYATTLLGAADEPRSPNP
jgi:DHA3 family macrolide efflux protein-like MFS transporter